MVARTAARTALLLGILIAAGQAYAQPTTSDAAAPTPADAGAEAPAQGRPEANAPTGIVPPMVEQAATVTYPLEAIAAAHFAEVKVVVFVEVDVTGAVTKVTPETFEPLGFTEAAVAAAQGLRFKPATRDGQPIAARIKYQFVFRPPLGRIAGRVATELDRGLPAKVVVTLADGTALEVKTAEDGTWSLVDVAPGRVAIRAGAPGWREAEATLEVAHAQEASVVLRLAREAPAPAIRALARAGSDEDVEQVQVRGVKPPREVTKRTLTKDEIEKIPGTNGDALRSLQSLPGVARPPMMGGQLIVRGSAPQDTTIYVDGSEIPIAYHFGGLSSVLPTEALDRIDFLPGNYGTTYGRGTGGMVDVGLRDPSQKLSGFAQLDLIDVRLLVEGPIGKSGWKFLAAGRRSWFDVWLSPILAASSSGVSTAPRYYDYQLMLKRDFSPRSSLRLVFFGSDDKLEIVQSTADSNSASFAGGIAAHTGFNRLQAIYQLRYASGGELRTVATLGRDNVDVGIGANYLGTTQYPLSLRSEVSQRLGARLRANVGVDLIYRPYDLSLRLPADAQPGRPPVPGSQPITASTSGEHTLAGLYTELEWTPWTGARLVPGFRVDYTSSTSAWDFSPRLVARQELGAGPLRTALKAGLGVYHQPPTALETDPTYGQHGLRSIRAIHYALGVEQPFTDHLELSIEGFAKQMDRLVVARQGNSGEGRVLGAETMLRYRGDPRFFGWLSYTLSRSERRDSSTEDWHRFQYDQTHNLTVVGSYNFGRGFSLGGRFRLISGNPYTPKASGGFDASSGGYVEIDRQPPYSEQLPLFHQLDVRFEKVWTFSQWKLSAYADIQNIYNRRGVEGFAYNFDYTSSTETRGLTILPSLGIRAELGGIR